ncbi:MAG: hypothetical protein O7F74_13000 [Bacteroidetes bacterium]|nr:hypothetical protein [Bacteroidota bacterium]
MKLIGIGGVSRSGKSELAQNLHTHYESQGKKVKILDQDKFIVDKRQIPRIKDRRDWEHPDSINWKTLSNEFYLQDNYDLKIVEGIFAFTKPEIARLFEKKIFIKISKETFLNRKSLDTRWGDEPQRYIEHIWESHIKFGIPEDPDIALNGDEKFNIKEIVKCLDLFHLT